MKGTIYLGKTCYSLQALSKIALISPNMIITMCKKAFFQIIQMERQYLNYNIWLYLRSSSTAPEFQRTASAFSVTDTPRNVELWCCQVTLLYRHGRRGVYQCRSNHIAVRVCFDIYIKFDSEEWIFIRSYVVQEVLSKDNSNKIFGGIRN